MNAGQQHDVDKDTGCEALTERLGTNSLALLVPPETILEHHTTI